MRASRSRPTASSASSSTFSPSATIRATSARTSSTSGSTGPRARPSRSTGRPRPAPVIARLLPDGGGRCRSAAPPSRCRRRRSSANGQRHIGSTCAATRARHPVALGGPWSFSFTETAGNAATIDIWVDREDTDVYPQFIKDDAVRENTITTPGNCQSVITVGSYDPDRFLGLGFFDFDLDEFSSWGPADRRPCRRRAAEAGHRRARREDHGGGERQVAPDAALLRLLQLPACRHERDQHGDAACRPASSR